MEGGSGVARTLTAERCLADNSGSEMLRTSSLKLTSHQPG